MHEAAAAPASSGTRRAPARATRWSSSSRSCDATSASRNPTIVCVTDTNDLDNQLVGDVRPPGAPRAAVAQAERDPARAGKPLGEQPVRAARRAGRRHRVHDDPEVPAGKDEATDASPLRARERDRHRRRGAPLPVRARSPATSLAALPNATRIGFTGTPIELGDRSTRVTFGDYISVYRMAPGAGGRRDRPDLLRVPPGACRRRPRRDRAGPADPRPGERRGADRAVGRVRAGWTRSSARPSAWTASPTTSPRTSPTAARTLPGKAMVVAYSRRIAAEYATACSDRLGEDAVDAVMSAQATDDRDRSATSARASSSSSRSRRTSRTPTIPCGSSSSRTCG